MTEVDCKGLGTATASATLRVRFKALSNNLAKSRGKALSNSFAKCGHQFFQHVLDMRIVAEFLLACQIARGKDVWGDALRLASLLQLRIPLARWAPKALSQNVFEQRALKHLCCQGLH